LQQIMEQATFLASTPAIRLDLDKTAAPVIFDYWKRASEKAPSGLPALNRPGKTESDGIPTPGRT